MDANFLEIVDRLKGLVYVYNSKRQCFDYINPYGISLSGFTLDELNRMTADALFGYVHPEDRPIYRKCWINKSQDTHVLQNLPIDYRRKDRWGQYHWLREYTSMFYDDLGDLDHMIGVAFNISREKADRDKLVKNHRELEELSHLLSHTFSEPIRSVRVLLQMIQNEKGTGMTEKCCDFLTEAISVSQSMEHMLNDLKRYFKAGNQEIAFCPVNLEMVFDAVIRKFPESPGIRIIPGFLPLVYGDETMLMDLFYTLLQTMFSPTPDIHPELYIESVILESKWSVHLTARNHGLDPGTRRRIIESFNREHPREIYPGSGMGLFICRRIVERHGGEIRVINDDFSGDDLTMTVTLPYAIEDDLLEQTL